jgi:hypothetical protein
VQRLETDVQLAAPARRGNAIAQVIKSQLLVRAIGNLICPL